MKIRQWEVWKSRPPGFARDHWFVILSGQERLDSEQARQINGLACYTLRGEPLLSDVILNGADGFEGPTVCACNLIFLLDRSRLLAPLGPVSWERQQQIKTRLRQVLRL